MEKYLLKATLEFRVPTVDDALALREEIEGIECGQLVGYSYKTKEIKAKGEVVEDWQNVKATIAFTEEKEPAFMVDYSFKAGF